MKIKLIVSLVFLLAFIRCTTANTVTIQGGDFSFSPSTVDVTVGDSIKWVWTSGGHTTTSVTVPNGAATWDALLDASHTSFIYVVTAAGTYNYHCSIHASMGMNGTFTANPIGITPISSNVPEKFGLYQNYPNPFNPSTNIKFDIPVRANVRIRIYDMTGRLVSELVNEKLQAGVYSVEWNASDYATGVYFYKLETPELTVTKKLALIK